MKYIDYLLRETVGEELDALKALKSTPEDQCVKRKVYMLYMNRGGVQTS